MFRPAERKKAKLRLGLTGPAGSGKTASALLIAYGITNDWSKIGLVDTENGSGELYANTTIGGTNIGQYNVLTITPPFEPKKYITAIKAAERAGLEVVILDSISHAWSGEGGLLDTQGKVASQVGNSYTAWRKVTPLHNEFIEAMLQSKIHVIATMRSKQEYIIEKDDRGKAVPRKMGMAPVQRDGMDYEFTVVFDLSQEHVASVSKDRTSIFDGKFFIPTPETGNQMKEWLEVGLETPAEAKSTEPPKPPQTASKPPEKENKPEEEASKPPKKEGPNEANLFNIVVMDEAKEAEGNLEAEIILFLNNGEEQVTLIADKAYKDLLIPGAALLVAGSKKDNEFTATEIKPVEEINKTTVKLLTAPKNGIFAHEGEKISAPWCYVEYQGKNKGIFAVGEVLGKFNEGDTLTVEIEDSISKDDKVMLFIKSAQVIEQSA